MGDILFLRMTQKQYNSRFLAKEASYQMWYRSMENCFTYAVNKNLRPDVGTLDLMWGPLDVMQDPITS